MRVAKEDGETNLADLLTKSLNLPKRKTTRLYDLLR